MSHTPGPWNVKAGRVVSGAVTICDVSIAYKSSESMEANARLIAAAPDLLAACKLLLSTFLLCASRFGEMPETMQALEAAIAKAEGRQ